MKQRLSISMCSWLIGPSPSSTRVDDIAVAPHQPVDGRPHAILGEAAHLEQPRLELLELLLESVVTTFLA